MLLKVKIGLIKTDPRSANEWGDETFAKLKNNIERVGLITPLVVMKYGIGNIMYRVLDGHFRLAVLKELGWNEVPVVVCTPKDETEVQLLLATLNSLRGTENIKKRATLIDSLSQVIPVPELAMLVPEDVDQIQDLIALARIEFDEIEKAVQEQVRQEEESLPVPYHFMVSKAEARLVDQALQQALGGGKKAKKKDFNKAFVALCQAYLTPPEAQKDG